MRLVYHIFLVLLIATSQTYAQIPQGNRFQLKGVVVGKENNVPISGVEVSTDKG